MTGRERIRTICAGGEPDRPGLWLGRPAKESWPGLHAYFGTRSEEELRRKLGDDFRWVGPHRAYRHPSGRREFREDSGDSVTHLSTGPLSDCEDPKELDDFEWPDTKYLDFTPYLEELRGYGDVYRASGMWTPFYHDLMDLFGMENYLMKMYTDPEVVRAATDRVCRYYYDANEILFEQAGDEIDGYFFGNDFGTQKDMLCGPAQFEEFILPWYKTFVDQGHRHGKQVILHSCGSIFKVIDKLIEAGADALHPLQALAAGMDAESLAASFKGNIAFMGGIDAQDLLVHGSPADVQREVRRVAGLLGPNYIVSPSHEAVLPDVAPANIEALAEAARTL